MAIRTFNVDCTADWFICSIVTTRPNGRFVLGDAMLDVEVPTGNLREFKHSSIFVGAWRALNAAGLMSVVSIAVDIEPVDGLYILNVNSEHGGNGQIVYRPAGGANVVDNLVGVNNFNIIWQP